MWVDDGDWFSAHVSLSESGAVSKAVESRGEMVRPALERLTARRHAELVGINPKACTVRVGVVYGLFLVLEDLGVCDLGSQGNRAHRFRVRCTLCGAVSEKTSIHLLSKGAKKAKRCKSCHPMQECQDAK